MAASNMPQNPAASALYLPKLVRDLLHSRRGVAQLPLPFLGH